MKLFVTDYGTIYSDNPKFREMRVVDFLRRLNNQTKHVSTKYDIDSRIFWIESKGMVNRDDDGTYLIKYNEEYYTLKCFQTYQKDFKRELDKLVTKCAPLRHNYKVISRFEDSTVSDPTSSEDVKVYYHYLKKHLRIQEFIKICYFIPTFIIYGQGLIACFAEMFGYNAVMKKYITYCLITFLPFYFHTVMWYRDFEKAKTVSLNIKAKLKLTKKRLKALENNMAVNNTKNSKNDVSTCERIVVNSAYNLIKIINKLDSENKKKYLLSIQGILADYGSMKGKLPKLASSNKIQTLESRFAMDTINKLNQLKQELELLTDQVEENTMAFANSSDLLVYLTKEFYGESEGQTSETTDGKKLVRALNTSVSKLS